MTNDPTFLYPLKVDPEISAQIPNFVENNFWSLHFTLKETLKMYVSNTSVALSQDVVNAVISWFRLVLYELSIFLFHNLLHEKRLQLWQGLVRLYADTVMLGDR